MDDDVKQAFERMDERFDAMMERLNEQHERLLNRFNRFDREAATTHEYLLEIAKSHGVRLRDIEGRLDRLGG
jgi:DNA anti-recombination protein RmuC